MDFSLTFLRGLILVVHWCPCGVVNKRNVLHNLISTELRNERWPHKSHTSCWEKSPSVIQINEIENNYQPSPPICPSESSIISPSSKLSSSGPINCSQLLVEAVWVAMPTERGKINKNKVYHARHYSAVFLHQQTPALFEYIYDAGTSPLLPSWSATQNVPKYAST